MQSVDTWMRDAQFDEGDEAVRQRWKTVNVATREREREREREMSSMLAA
jgi:hypothetical protein